MTTARIVETFDELERTARDGRIIVRAGGPV
jgi:hypothetical protein